MAVIVRMPEVLANATEAALQTWLVAIGDAVTVGQPIADIETDKAMVEYSAESEGVLLRTLVEPGVSVDVGAPIAVIGSASDSAEEIDALLAKEGGATPSAVGEPAPIVLPAPPAAAAAAVDSSSGAPLAEPASVPDEPVQPGPTLAPESAASAADVDADPTADAAPGRVFASPIVRRLAKERSIDLGSIRGTGPAGRIVRRDLDAAPLIAPAAPVAQAAPPVAAAAPAPAAPAAAPAAAAAAPAAPSASEAGSRQVPHTGMRRAIARRLTESKTTVPHFYVTADCRMDALLELRGRINESAKRRISVNDFIVKAVALALVEVPEANAIWGIKAMTVFDSVDLAIAVSTDGGLLTPVLRGVESLSLSSISESISALASRAREGRLTQGELEGGSFAISNLGMYGVDQFAAILNPPQAGILAVGAAKPRPIVVDGALQVGSVMTVTLSADHRVIDGAVAAQWLAAFVRRIEEPLSILI